MALDVFLAHLTSDVQLSSWMTPPGVPQGLVADSSDAHKGTLQFSVVWMSLFFASISRLTRQPACPLHS